MSSIELGAARSLARAGMIVSAAFLASRVLGWVRLVVIGNTFGATADLDAFFAAFRIPDLIFQLVAAGALSSALIPVLAGLFAADEQSRAWRVVSTVANLVLCALAILASIVFVAAPVLVPIITRGFDEATTELTIELTRIMLLSAIFLALGAVATSVLNARGRFAAAALAPIVYNLAIIGAAVLLAPTMGVVGLAVGVVAGAIGHLAIQLGPVHSLGFRYVPHVDTHDAAARRALALMAPRAVGLGATQITFVVMTSLATTLGVGAVTALTVAFTLLQIPVGVIGVPLGVVLFPSLSREAATGNQAQFVGLLTRALRVIVFVMVPVAALTGLLRTEVVVLLFGTSFAPDAIILTAQTLLAFVFGLVAHSLIAVLARSFYARQDTLTPVLAAVGAVIVNTTLAILLVDPFGLPGVAIAIAIAAWLEALTLLVILRDRIPSLALGEVGWVGVRTTVATAVATVAGAAILLTIGPTLVPDPTVVPLSGLPALIVEMVLVTGGFGLVFVGAALVMRITELRSITALMVSSLRRPASS